MVDDLKDPRSRGPLTREDAEFFLTQLLSDAQQELSSKLQVIVERIASMAHIFNNPTPAAIPSIVPTGEAQDGVVMPMANRPVEWLSITFNEFMKLGKMEQLVITQMGQYEGHYIPIPKGLSSINQMEYPELAWASLTPRGRCAAWFHWFIGMVISIRERADERKDGRIIRKRILGWARQEGSARPLSTRDFDELGSMIIAVSSSWYEGFKGVLEPEKSKENYSALWNSKLIPPSGTTGDPVIEEVAGILTDLTASAGLEGGFDALGRSFLSDQDGSGDQDLEVELAPPPPDLEEERLRQLKDDVHRKYEAAVQSFEQGDFETARAGFVLVEGLIPGFKDTVQYLSDIDVKIEEARLEREKQQQREELRMKRAYVYEVARRAQVPVHQLRRQGFQIHKEMVLEPGGEEYNVLVRIYDHFKFERNDRGLKDTYGVIPYLLARLGILGPQVYDGDQLAKGSTVWQRMKDMVEILGVKRIYLDLDETLIKPAGWVGGEDWFAVRNQQIHRAKPQQQSHEARMITADYFQATDPYAVDIILEWILEQEIEVVGLTARYGRDRKKIEAIFQNLGLEFPVIYVGSHRAGSKVERIQRDQREKGTEGVPTLLVDNNISYLESAEAAHVDGLHTAHYQDAFYSRWKDPFWYLEEVEGRESDEALTAADQEHLINALELSQNVELNLEQRIEVGNRVADQIDLIQDADEDDFTPLMQSFLLNVSNLVYHIQSQELDAVNKSPQLLRLLERYFVYFFPDHSGHMLEYYKDGLISLIQSEDTTKGDEYYFEVNETNIFAYLQPLLRRILLEEPDTILLFDSGARPMYWAIEAFIKQRGMKTKVELMPLSIKTNGDTLKSTNHWDLISLPHPENIAL